MKGGEVQADVVSRKLVGSDLILWFKGRFKETSFTCTILERWQDASEFSEILMNSLHQAGSMKLRSVQVKKWLSIACGYQPCARMVLHHFLVFVISFCLRLNYNLPSLCLMLVFCGIAWDELKKVKMWFRYEVTLLHLSEIRAVSSSFPPLPPNISTNNLCISCPGDEELRQPAYHHWLSLGSSVPKGKKETWELGQFPCHMDPG